MSHNLPLPTPPLSPVALPSTNFKFLPGCEAMRLSSLTWTSEPVIRQLLPLPWKGVWGVCVCVCVCVIMGVLPHSLLPQSCNHHRSPLLTLGATNSDSPLCALHLLWVPLFAIVPQLFYSLLLSNFTLDIISLPHASAITASQEHTVRSLSCPSALSTPTLAFPCMSSFHPPAPCLLPPPPSLHPNTPCVSACVCSFLN